LCNSHRVDVAGELVGTRPRSGSRAGERVQGVAEGVGRLPRLPPGVAELANLRRTDLHLPGPVLPSLDDASGEGLLLDLDDAVVGDDHEVDLAVALADLEVRKDPGGHAEP
jgi:hypothetical protein